MPLPNPAPVPSDSPPTDGASRDPAPTPKTYPQHGFVVHEWGTNTVVSASNGTLEVGLHHEEEDLPGFVYDRLKTAVGQTDALERAGGIDVKMETPVLYFYSSATQTVHARVDFPNGVLTQWYPGVVGFKPPLLWEDLNAEQRNPPRDPALDPAIAISAPYCNDHYRRGGMLDWGAFELLTAPPAERALPAAPIDEFAWSYAREVASNAVRFPDGETEKFLFYRGLSNVELPAKTLASGAGHLSIDNVSSAPLGPVFVVDVTAESGAFRVAAAGVGAGATGALEVPAESERQPLDAFTAALGDAVTSALDATGLYHDEAVAMVNTWRRQWFLTPGLRVFYLAPQIWTDAVLPLTLDPIPDELVRVMVVRVELLTPEVEAEDARAVELLATDATSARAHFEALGRFAEPRLRRALELAPSAAGDAYLNEFAPQVPRASEL